MIDRSDISDMVERISDKVSCRTRHRGLFYGILGGVLVVSLIAVVWFVRRRRSEEDDELLDQAETGWDGESLPDTFPNSMREHSAGDFGEGDDAAVPGNRARRNRKRDTHGGLSSAEGDVSPMPA
ncbi:MAG TPA: hypothetical protein VHO02_00825 [Fibrobacteria bacterium]|jgi:hypothetical protein|nr:hypothetical protein [Fibrobacteria bacterium]